MTDHQVRSLRAKILGAMLRETRLQSGESMRAAGDLIGVSSSVLSSYEHGRRAVSLPELEILAYHFDISLSKFLSASPDEIQEQTGFDPRTFLMLRQRMVGAKLRAHRLDREWSIKELAERVGLPTSRVSAYERGERPIPIPELEAMAETLGHALKDYLDDEGPVAEWNTYKEASDRLRTLPAELISFLADPESDRYLTLAMELRALDAGKLNAVADALRQIAL